MDVMEIVRKHRLPIPTNHFLTLKSLITAEGTARLMYPQLDVIGEGSPMSGDWPFCTSNPMHSGINCAK